MSPPGTTSQAHAGRCVCARGGGTHRSPPPAPATSPARTLQTATDSTQGRWMDGWMDDANLGMAGKKSPLLPSGSHSQCEAGDAPTRSQQLLGAKLGLTVLLNTERALGSLRPRPPILNPAMCFIRLILRGRGETTPPLTPALETSSASSCQFGESQRPTWSTETHVRREKPTPLPPRYLHPASLQVLKFNSFQLGQ